ncbi:hypothetical protein D3C80_1906550 [compost metagenome]
MHIIDARTVLLFLPGCHHRFLQDRLTDPVERFRGAGQHRQQTHNPFGGLIDILDVGKRVKA